MTQNAKSLLSTAYEKACDAGSAIVDATGRVVETVAAESLGDGFERQSAMYLKGKKAALEEQLETADASAAEKIVVQIEGLDKSIEVLLNPESSAARQSLELARNYDATIAVGKDYKPLVQPSEIADVGGYIAIGSALTAVLGWETCRRLYNWATGAKVRTPSKKE